MTDRQLVKEARSFRRGIVGGADSTGMCYAVSAALQGWLSFAHQVETKCVTVDFPSTNHVWLELEDGRILDATADQFSTARDPLPEVYLGPIPPRYRRWIAAERRKRRMCASGACSAAQAAPKTRIYEHHN